jgi:pSer/pThr/pTyr-binding forkhead associated (FHA) protein
MSGEHFAVEGDGTVWRIRDLKSRNGTKVNGKRITSVELNEGDRIHAGSTDFIVHLETEAAARPVDDKLLSTLPPAVPPGQTEDRKGITDGPAVPPPPPVEVQAERPRREPPTPAKPVTPRIPPEASQSIEQQPREVPVSLPEPAKPRPAKPTGVPAPIPDALLSYEAVTPGGRLLKLLQSQPQPLLALLDATQEKKVLKLLHESGEEFQSLYQNPQQASIAPYLVSLPPESALLRKMVYDGWGRSWGVYLTCPISLALLRDYFRRELMVRLPDGVELFSRFYDPRFFRAYLDTCTPAEAERFFGPVSSYLIEAEKPEIVLEFTRTIRGVEKKGHLLSEL